MTDCGTCGADLGPSDTFIWHYDDEDCRAVRQPTNTGGAEA